LRAAGRRTALSRHRTLSAALDWSYDFLAETERIILRRLAIFDGYFTLESAIAVVGTSEMGEPDIVEGLANLVTRSLVVADISSEVVHYRLLQITRAYASGKLRDSGELAQTSERHDQNLRSILERAGLQPSGMPLNRRP
jgi:predicted ATPase